MNKKRIAIVGYGNIGRYSLEAIETAPDFEIAGIVRRNSADREDIPAEIPVVGSIKELQNVDVAILATPTRSVEEHAKEILAMGINTVDSFDIHGQIPELRKRLDEASCCRQDGIREAIPWCVHCLRLLLPRESHILISVPE